MRRSGGEPGPINPEKNPKYADVKMPLVVDRGVRKMDKQVALDLDMPNHSPKRGSGVR